MTIKITIEGTDWNECLTGIKDIAGVEPVMSTPVEPTPVKPVASAPVAETAQETDINGDVFDSSIHQRVKTANGSWKKKPKRKKAETVEAATSAPSPVEAVQPAPAPSPVETVQPALAPVEAVQPASAQPVEGATFGEIMKLYVKLDSTDNGRDSMLQIAAKYGLASLPEINTRKDLFPVVFQELQALL